MNSESQKLADYQLRPDRDLTVLIPARSGSKRIPGKNTKLLGGKPLIQWTIDAVKAANAKQIFVSTDDRTVERICKQNGISWHIRRPEHATDDAPDILWVLMVLPFVHTPYIAICRPTSPFRTASTIRRGYAAFMHSGCDSLRAVEPVTEHPGKMWMDWHGQIRPVLETNDVWENDLVVPWHSMPTQSLPNVYKQNASLEIAKVSAIKQTRSISGHSVHPFFSDATERFDINTPEDWIRAEAIASSLLSPAPSPSPAERRPGS